MNRFQCLALAVVAGACFAATAPKVEAQVVVGIGVAPECPYGYYDYSPYPCAPYGYYGPEWFTGGIFIGAGPWFHGRHDFHGHVDNRFDAQRGYRGRMPNRGERPTATQRPGRIANFRGNEMRDGRGHVSGGDDRHH
jgi:hypothetical protein